MAGFKGDGDVSFAQKEDLAVFCLKNSEGKDIKSFMVPTTNADEFANCMKADEPRLREEAGETDPLCLIRVSKCF